MTAVLSGHAGKMSGRADPWLRRSWGEASTTFAAAAATHDHRGSPAENGKQGVSK